MSTAQPLTPAQRRLAQGAVDLVQRVAKAVARRYRDARVDDLVSAGREALVDAARTYDPTRGVPFEAFAYLRIHGEMRDQAARERVLGSDAVRRALRVGQDALDAGSNEAEPDVLTDTIEEARGRAASWASEIATSFTLAFLAGPASADPTADAAGALERESTLQALRAAVERLPADDAALAREHYIEGVPLAAIATRRGLAERTLQRHHRRLLETLRRSLAAVGVKSSRSA